MSVSPAHVYSASLLVALLSAGIGTLIYRRLSGAWPLVADLDEWRLRSTPWAQLEQTYEANPRRSSLVVCLTTIPSRLDYLQITLASLLRQTVRPAEIRLHLPEYSQREGRSYEVPAWLAATPCVTVVPCEDYGPATKLIPALSLAPSQPILVLDDDRLYGPGLVEDMDAAWQAHPDAICCGSGWSLPPDLLCRSVTLGSVLRGDRYVPIFGTNVREAQRVDILQGVQSYVAQPRFFSRSELLDYSQAPPEAHWCDDVWISGHARAPRLVVPIRRISRPHRVGRRHLKETSLARNFNSKDDPEARSNTVLMRYFRELQRW